MTAPAQMPRDLSREERVAFLYWNKPDAPPAAQLPAYRWRYSREGIAFGVMVAERLEETGVADSAVRAANAIELLELRSVEDICATPDARFLSLRNFGAKSLKQIRKAFGPYAPRSE